MYPNIVNINSCNRELIDAFQHRFSLNRKGGRAARLARLQVMPWLIAQRFGCHFWVQAPLFFGQKMWVLTGETISRGLLAFGYAEVALTALMLAVLRPGMRFIDVGAHLGYEALLASTLVGDAGRVVSFEPQPSIFSYTERNLRQCAAARVVSAAVADSNGELGFHELPLTLSAFSGSKTGNAAGRQIKVRATRLDDALLGDERPVDFIKVDVEGAETSVLRGAAHILANDKPMLVLEAEMPSANSSRPRAKEFEDFLSPLGYQGISFEFDGALRVAPLGGFVEGHANVAFVPRGRAEFESLRLP